MTHYDLPKERVELMVDHILKNCLWQFHSRSWDRKRQNAEILLKTRQILCGEPMATDTPADRCYMADAICLAEAYQEKFPWLADMDKEEIKLLIATLHERLDHLTIGGSLNEELNDQHY
ncbi:Nitrogenase iron-iron protein delta chain [Rhodovastum atsumiense]|uniref:Nitrogenase iron-iron protein delta chain n=1 Tax=Rhodovastum atsumiense TaxID=504468 RepID=A0A5M6IMW4_9PROT|nr:Fe-only nitrogenase subunit delta [Rhodovastum atsumiense]KAA5609209.1 Fe-only nitrogenase subunit delta [Rhodovastum atsumiense]CAH2603962.1 Nitrogenase iron-iron protein delta chain [Rhodovastum atsumiense]